MKKIFFYIVIPIFVVVFFYMLTSVKEAKNRNILSQVDQVRMESALNTLKSSVITCKCAFYNNNPSCEVEYQCNSIFLKVVDRIELLHQSNSGALINDQNTNKNINDEIVYIEMIDRNSISCFSIYALKNDQIKRHDAYYSFNEKENIFEDEPYRELSFFVESLPLPDDQRIVELDNNAPRGWWSCHNNFRFPEVPKIKGNEELRKLLDKEGFKRRKPLILKEIEVRKVN